MIAIAGYYQYKNKKMAKNICTLDDFLKQMQQVRKLGPLQNILGMLPGMGQVKDQLKDTFPFNKDFTNFFNETDKYSNTLRVQWINDHKSSTNLDKL